MPLQRKPGGVRGFPPSWNGPLFDAAVVREVGVPRADLFFWAEDTSPLARLREAGHRRTHVPGAEVMHLNPGARRRGQARNWQLYYEVRNTLEYRLRIRRRTVKGVARAVGGVLGKLASIVLLEPGKRRSLRWWWMGSATSSAGGWGVWSTPIDGSRGSIHVCSRDSSSDRSMWARSRSASASAAPARRSSSSTGIRRPT